MLSGVDTTSFDLTTKQIQDAVDFAEARVGGQIAAVVASLRTGALETDSAGGMGRGLRFMPTSERHAQVDQQVADFEAREEPDRKWGVLPAQIIFLVFWAGFLQWFAYSVASGSRQALSQPDESQWTAFGVLTSLTGVLLLAVPVWRALLPTRVAASKGPRFVGTFLEFSLLLQSYAVLVTQVLRTHINADGSEVIDYNLVHFASMVLGSRGVRCGLCVTAFLERARLRWTGRPCLDRPGLPLVLVESGQNSSHSRPALAAGLCVGSPNRGLLLA